MPDPATDVVVRAPLAGTVVALADVPDPVFAEQMVGPGLAIEPDVGPEGERSTTAALAPVDGIVSSLRRHAFVVTAAAGRSVLVHLGIDTVGADLGGEVHVEVDAACAAGTPVVSWRPGAVVAAGRVATCPVVALQADPGSIRLLVAPGEHVEPGQPVLTWA